MNNNNSHPGGRQGRPGIDENRLSGIYGDHLKQKRSGMVRILFQNPQGLGRLSSERNQHSDKINKLKDTLIKHNVDLVGFSEINKDWRRIPQRETFWACTEGWFEHRRMTTGINELTPITSETQFGGVLIMAMNRIAYSISDIAKDFRNLGRWTSIALKGKNQKICRIICAYCPCQSSGPNSTYALQVVGLARQNIMVCPRRQFWEDLRTYITTCKDAGETVIIMGDWNSKYEEVVRWMTQLGLKDAIVSRHRASPPPTCKRSSIHPIDAIFVPESFKCWRGGYLSFNYLESDHRGLWCDIPVEFLLGYNMQHPAHAGARRLKNTDPRIRKKYTRNLHEMLLQHNVYEKMEELHRSMQQSVLPTDVIKFEELDNIINAAMKEAEQKCRKLKTGIIPWSPLYQQACDRVTYWSLVKDEMMGVRVNIRKIRSLRNKLKIPRDQAMSLATATAKLRLAINNRTQCKRHAPELQMEYRYRLAKAKEEDDNIPAATHIRNLTQQENTRALFRRIRYLERKLNNLSTTRVIISDKQGRQREICNRPSIEQHLMEANEKKYHQTENGCPLTKGQLCKDIGLLGEGPKVQDILNGTYRYPPGTNNATKDFLRQLKCPPGFRSCEPISFEEFKQGWIKTKERTSSCGPHFGHYKAAMSHPQMAKLLYLRALIPMQTGYSPNRHRMGIDVMLLKKENNYHVDSLRTIVLFDSEANMNYKHLGRRSMQNAISQQQIATEQYSRPKRKAIDHALNRKLIMDHQLYQRQPYAITSCDLKSCYDRIVHAPASLALQRIGIPRTEIISMFDSIQRMRHKIRTSFGDSSRTYGGNNGHARWKLPPQGVLQGNGSGPSVWAILSSVIFKILESKGLQNIFASSITQVILKLAGFAYVDDSDLIQVADSTQQVARKMQVTLNTWTASTGVTGGILAPQKCWWYLVNFEYKRGRWNACSPRRESQLWIKSNGKDKTLVSRLEPTQGMNMLGVYLAPDGNTQDHVSYLRRKAEQWAENMRHSTVNREEVWTALQRTIPFAMAYSLPASTLTRDECKFIMAPIFKTGLPRAGIASTIASSIRVGPISHGGLGLLDAYTHMGVSQVETLISHMWQKTPTGRLLEMALEDIALELGLVNTWQPTVLKRGLEYASTTTWIRHVLRFTVENNITLHIGRDYYHKLREHDQTIMENALEYSRNAQILKSINAVRMALKVVWIGDISTADGTLLDSRCFHPEPAFPRRNNYKWPQKHQTSPKDWTIWRSWLSSICQGTRRQLRNPVGHWQGTSQDWLVNWDCFINDEGDTLFLVNEDSKTWHRHIIQPGRARRYNRYYTDHLVYRELPVHPNTLLRASVVSRRGYIQVTAVAQRPRVWQRPGPHTNLWVVNLPVTQESIVQKIEEILHPIYIEKTNSLDILFRDFSNGQVVAVSDGSYFPDIKRAAAAWIIESQCRTQWIMGSIMVPGPIEDFSAYRSELTGLLAITITLKLLSCCFSQPRHLIIGCDGDAALTSLTQAREDITANSAHSDLQSMMVDLWDTMDIRPYPVHIKGHQDSTGKKITRLEYLNILMDKLATLTASSNTNTGAPLYLPQIGLSRVLINNRLISGNLTKSLYHSITTARLLQYLQHSVLGATMDMHCIDFQAFGKARSQAPQYLNTFISKWLSNTLPTGIILQQRKHRIFNRCPRCNHWGEDWYHIIQCWDARAKMIWNKQIDLLTQLLQKQQTCPTILSYLLQGVQSIRQRRIAELEPTSDWQRELIKIGWKNIVTGFLGRQIIQSQDRYYKQIGSNKTGTRWASRLILHWWGMIHKMWIGRNDVLHKKEIINALSGQCLLDIEVEREYDAGYEMLPETVHKWFRFSKDHLLAQSTDYKKGWLLIIKTVKESLNIAEYSIFTSSRSLRRWIGLRPH
jgi:exonuclease III